MRSKPFRILSLSGGGIRGVFQACYLENVFGRLGKSPLESFDLVAGTSTGAIVALGIGLGLPIESIASFYRNRAKKAFKRRPASVVSGPKFDAASLRGQLEEVFGDARLKDSKVPVLIPATWLNRFEHKLFSNAGPNAVADGELRIVDVAMASSAAPTYLDPATPTGGDRSYVDGGLWANSPTAVAVWFAETRLGVLRESIRVLSIGNGTYPHGSHARKGRRRVRWGYSSIRRLINLIFESQESFAEEFAQSILPEDRYLRVNAKLRKPIAMDAIKKAVKSLPALAEGAAEESHERVRELLELENGWVDTPIGDELLVPREIVREAGLTAFYPSREYYGTHRAEGSSIGRYVQTAKKTILLVSINLQTGIAYQELIGRLREKLESQHEEVAVTISLLNPKLDHLMKSVAAIPDLTAPELSESIRRTIGRLRAFRDRLAPAAKRRLALRVHNSLPFGSAILIDHAEPSGRIQIETKPFGVAMQRSFGFEVGRASSGLYESLVEGFEMLVREGEGTDDDYTENHDV